MSDEVANIPADVQVETTKSKKPRYTVEISQFESGQSNPIRIPCELVQENTTSYRVRVTFPNGEVRIIRKNKSKVFSDQPQAEKLKEDPKSEKADEKKKSDKKSGKKKNDSVSTATTSEERPKPKRNGRISKS